MARHPKQYQAFSTLTDRLLAVSRAELERRLKDYREQPRTTGSKRGPKPKATRSTAS